MSTVQRFENLEIWQLAREISRKIFYVTKNIPKQTNSGIINQIRKLINYLKDSNVTGQKYR